ncbi:MAG: hypothetical protein JNG90_09430, partial [Planctomycetaceae bacterium]|nr:hypothetical protein [Planctomycetaceae bacterium]
NENQASDTAWILLALEGYRGEQSPAHRQALESGRAWLAQAAPAASQQDLAFALLLAARAGRPASELHVTSEKLRARQRPDGGWAQLDESPTDAFATGQSLYALALAGETAEQPAIQRGIDWLVAHQRPDGGWTMASRASNDGSPGGSSKLLTPIECGAASWATLGLAKLVPQSR